MKIDEILRKYNSFINPIKWRGNYINIIVLELYFLDLLENWFIINWFDFLEVSPIKTQPYMELSLWNDDWYTKENFLNESFKIKNLIIDKKLDLDDCYVEMLIK